MLERLAHVHKAAQIAVAIPDLRADDPLAELCVRLKVSCYRGSPLDVLDRYYQCAKWLGSPDSIVRLTGDCPLHDPRLIDQVITHFHPDGLDVEIFTFAALETAWRQARRQIEREHVTFYLHSHPQLFKLGAVRASEDRSNLRWTLDEECDVRFLREIFARLYPGNFSTEDILQVLKREPQLLKINSHLSRNSSLARHPSE